MDTSIERQIQSWRDGAISELKPMRDLLQTGNPRQALFWAHLAVEKALKAQVTKATQNVAPYTHSLLRLAAIADIILSDEQKNLLEDLNGFQQTGRYNDSQAEIGSDLEPGEAEEYINKSEELVQWLTKRL